MLCFCLKYLELFELIPCPIQQKYYFLALYDIILNTGNIFLTTNLQQIVKVDFVSENPELFVFLQSQVSSRQVSYSVVPIACMTMGGDRPSWLVALDGTECCHAEVDSLWHGCIGISSQKFRPRQQHWQDGSSCFT